MRDRRFLCEIRANAWFSVKSPCLGSRSVRLIDTSSGVLPNGTNALIHSEKCKASMARLLLSIKACLAMTRRCAFKSSDSAFEYSTTGADVLVSAALSPLALYVSCSPLVFFFTCSICKAFNALRSDFATKQALNHMDFTLVIQDKHTPCECFFRFLVLTFVTL